MTVLDVKDLRTYFYTNRGTIKAVDGVSYDLEKGEVLCLVGESGSGKTVSALSILGLIDPPGKIIGGEIKMNGENLREFSRENLRSLRGGRIGMIFQDPFESLNPVLSIGDQIMEAMDIHLDIKSEDAKTRAIDLLRQVGIESPEEKLKSYPHEFSGGMNQRVMIAIALSCEPEILIADEPTSALDVTTQSQFLQLLMHLKKEREMSLVFITHDLGIVAEIASRIVVMYAGKVMERGSVWQIFEKPRHPYTIGLLKSLPDIAEEKRSVLTPIPGTIPSLINPPSGCVFHPRCVFSRDICSAELPPEHEFEKGHLSACHFWDSSEVKDASEEVRVVS